MLTVQFETFINNEISTMEEIKRVTDTLDVRTAADPSFADQRIQIMSAPFGKGGIRLAYHAKARPQRFPIL